MVSKVNFLRLISHASLFSLIPVRRKIRVFWDTLALLLVIVLVIYTIQEPCWYMLKSTTSPDHAPSPRPPPPGVNGDFKPPPVPQPPKNINQIGGPDDDPSEIDGGQVIAMSETSTQLLGHLINILHRVFGFILASQMQEIYGLFQKIQLPRALKKWKRNELFSILLIIVSVGVGAMDLVTYFVDFRDPEAPGPGPPPPPSMRLEQQSETADAGQMIVEILRKIAQVFIGGAFVNECATVILVFFTTLVADAVKEVSDDLEIPKQFLLLPPQEAGKPMESKPVSVIYPNEFPVDSDFSMKMDPNLRGKEAWSKVSLGNGGKEHDTISSALYALEAFMMETYHGRKVLEEEEQQQKSKLKFTSISDRYLEWAKLWQDASVVTGTATALTFFLTTVNLCISSFLFFSSAVDVGFFQLSTIQNGLMTLLRVGRLVVLGNAAQYLIDAGAELEEKVLMQFWLEEDTGKGRTEDQDERDRHVSYLLHQMAQNPMQLSALGFFDVSRSTLTSIGGVIITYLVVLIQFKSAAR